MTNEIQYDQFTAVDDGFAETKIFNKNGKFKIRSMVRTGVHLSANIFETDKPSDDRGYETEGLKYTAGDSVQGEDTRFDGYIGSALNRVIVHHGLHVAGLSGQDVTIATGLPINRFYNGDKINADIINKKRESFSIPVTTLGPEAPVNVKANIVCSEGVSAYLDYLLDIDGNPNFALTSDPVGVVDIGGRTTDCVWVNPPSSIDKRSGTEDIGVLDIYKAVHDSLRTHMGVSEIPRIVVERAIKTNMFRKFGTDYDVTELVANAINTVTEQIYREIQRRLGDGTALAKIIFVGGGVALLPGIAARYENAFVPEDPEFANARGMYKYLRYLDNQNKATKKKA